jgi:putative membrane protein
MRLAYFPCVGEPHHQGKGKNMRSIVFLTVAWSLAAVISCDRNRAESTSRAESGADRSDKNFVHDIAIANMAEVELAKLVPERSTDDETKKFAQLMIDDHTKSLNSLKAMAAQHNIPVPTELSPRYMRLRDKLAKWHGNEFERNFMETMIDEHEDMLDELDDRVDERTLAEYKAEIADRLAGKKTVEQARVVAILPEKSDNAVTFTLNEWAAANYPTVRAHLDAARVLKTAVDKRPRTTN